MKSRLLLILFIGLFFQDAYSYVRTRTDSGQEISWLTNGSQIPFYINSNLSGNGATSFLNESTSNTIILNSVNAWNLKSPLKLNPVVGLSPPSAPNAKVGTISYSANPAYFGEGVLAITKVSFNSLSGTITSADILINDSFMNFTTLTATASSSGNGFAFLGDVVTHEIGHLLGLAHTEMPSASMLYSIFKNQHQPSEDEYLAVQDIYGGKNKRINGKVVGGKDKAVFGANVLLISQQRGKVLTSQLSDEEGNFSFSNIPSDDSYFIAVMPVKNKSNLPEFYSSINTDFCKGEFVPSLFTKCAARSKGRAQAFNLANHVLSELDVGKVTVRCDLGLSSEYLFEKIQNERKSIPFYNYHNLGVSESYLGFVYDQDLNEETADTFHINLLSYQARPNEFLKLNLLVESLATAVDFKVEIKNLTTEAVTVLTPNINMISGKKELDQTFYLPLSLNAEENDYEVKLTPRKLPLSQQNEIFSGATELVNEKKIYLLTSALVQRNGSEYFPIELGDSYPYEDNGHCLEGDVPYESKASRSLANDTSQDDQGQNSLSCGTIGPVDGSGPGPGPMSFLLGFAFVIIFSFPRFNRSNFLSK